MLESEWKIRFRREAIIRRAVQRRRRETTTGLMAEREQALILYARMGTRPSHIAVLLDLPRSIVQSRIDHLRQTADGADTAAKLPAPSPPPMPLRSPIEGRSKPPRIRPAA
jgi:hypothetical protein